MQLADIGKKLLVFAAALALILVAFYLPSLTGSLNFFLKDTTHFFEPLCSFVAQRLRSGSVPLWNPYSYCGMSQAAITSPSIFYPPNWLFAAMPFSAALAVITILSQVVCAAGMFLLIELLGWGLVPAIIAGCAAGLSGYMFTLVSNYTLVSTASWVPLCFYFSLRQLRGGEFKWLFLNAVVVGLMLSAGRPEISIPALAMVAMLGLLNQPAERKRLIDFFKSLTMGVLMAMPTIMPALEWIPLSRRSQGLAPMEILLYSANWYQLLSLFIIEPLDNFQLRSSPFSVLLSGVDMVPYFDSAYVGVLVLALSMIGIFRRGGRLYLAALALLVLSVVFALGHNFPFMAELLPFIPFASFLRFPSKLLFFAVLALALFAARGASIYLRGEAKLQGVIIAFAALVLSAIGLVVSNRVVLPFQPGADPSLADTAQTVLGLRLASQSFIGLVALVFMHFMSKFGKQKSAAAVVALAVFASLMTNGLISAHFGAPADYYDKRSPLVARVALPTGANASERVTPLILERFTVPPSVDQGGRLQSTVNDYQYTRQVFKAFTNIDAGVPSQFGFEGSMVGEYHYFFLNMYVRSSQSLAHDQDQRPSDLPLYRLLQCGSTRYVLTQARRQLSPDRPAIAVPDLDPVYFERVLSDESLNVQVWKLKQTLPRAYVTSNWHYFDSRDQLLSYMAEAQRSGFNPASETLIESDIGQPDSARGAITPVAIESPQPETVIARVNSRQKALLVLQDQMYPGWTVDIDGQSSEVLRCNGFMKAVVVPPGSHTVTFRFLPMSVVTGLSLLALALLWCALLKWQAKGKVMVQTP